MMTQQLIHRVLRGQKNALNPAEGIIQESKRQLKDLASSVFAQLEDIFRDLKQSKTNPQTINRGWGDDKSKPCETPSEKAIPIFKKAWRTHESETNVTRSWHFLFSVWCLKFETGVKSDRAGDSWGRRAFVLSGRRHIHADVSVKKATHE